MTTLRHSNYSLHGCVTCGIRTFVTNILAVLDRTNRENPEKRA